MNLQENGWNRREFVRAAAVLGIALGTPGCVSMAALDPNDAPSERQLAMMREVAQTVIPRTDTPGAGDAGAGAFVVLALAHGMDGTRNPAASAEMAFALPVMQRSDGSLRYVDWLDSKLGSGWIELPADQRKTTLAMLDASAFASGAEAHPWRKLKGLILTGYYTSQEGGAQELQYAAVPGRFDPRVLVGPNERGYSSDWTGVEFG